LATESNGVKRTGGVLWLLFNVVKLIVALATAGACKAREGLRWPELKLAGDVGSATQAATQFGDAV
jgi:hypothetical protein